MRPWLLLLVGVTVSRAEDAPVESPAPVPVALPASGDAVLERAIDALSAGRYDEALAVSIPAIGEYPALAVSFRAVAEVAADQLERRRGSPAAPAATRTEPSPYAPRSSVPSTRTGLPAASPYAYRREGRRPRPTLGFGFEVGAPTGFRAELDVHAQKPGSVDAVGLRFGGNTLLYDGVRPVTDITGYVDFKIDDRWQFEALVGTFVSFGWMYPTIGGAVQFDPAGPLFVDGGARVGPYGSILPDANVGFLW